MSEESQVCALSSLCGKGGVASLLVCVCVCGWVGFVGFVGFVFNGRYWAVLIVLSYSWLAVLSFRPLGAGRVTDSSVAWQVCMVLVGRCAVMLMLMLLSGLVRGWGSVVLAVGFL